MPNDMTPDAIQGTLEELEATCVAILKGLPETSNKTVCKELCRRLKEHRNRGVDIGNLHAQWQTAERIHKRVWGLPV